MKGASDLGPLLQPLATDPVELDEAIRELLKYSLVQRDPHTEMLSLHRLVQDVLKDEMDEETQRMWAEQTVKAVNRLFPDGEYVIRSDYQRSLPHAQVCIVYIERWNMMFIEAAQLLNRSGWYLWQYAQHAQAEMFINLALLADYYHQDYPQAEQYYQRAVTICKQALGPNHPDVATSLHSLALFYYYQGKHYRGKEKHLKYSLAESLFQRVLTIREHALEPNHPETATILNDLGRLYFVQGKYKQAEQFCKQVLAIREQALEPNNPRIATTLDNLARIYRAQEVLEEAELLYREALTIRTQILGPNHTSVDDCLKNLVELYKAQDKYTEIESLYQEAVRNYERVLGPDHSSTTIARSKYARLLQKAKHEQEQQEALRRPSSWFSRLQKRRKAEAKPDVRKQEDSASETNYEPLP